MSRRPKSYWPWSTGTQTLVEPKTRAIVSLIGVAARTIAGAQMPNALPVPAMPASLRKERRWSAISSLLWSCSRVNEHANRVPRPRSVWDYIGGVIKLDRRQFDAIRVRFGAWYFLKHTTMTG